MYMYLLNNKEKKLEASFKTSLILDWKYQIVHLYFDGNNADYNYYFDFYAIMLDNNM